jgi:rod shape-determining protein MreC
VNLPTHVKEVSEPLFNHQDQLAKTNQDLKREQIYLQAQVQKLRALEAENQELRELLKSVAHSKETFSEGRLVHANVDPFIQQVLLNKGKVEGIEMGQPVIDSFGLVGVVTGINEYTSQVLLVTDPSFAVPVQSVRSGERAIANGSGAAGELRLNYVPRTADFMEGDILVTSGIGGRFPAGYPVGTITSIQHDPGTRFTLVAISPMAKLGRLKHVLFVKHDSKAASLPFVAANNEAIVTPPEEQSSTSSSTHSTEPTQ